MVSEVSVCMKSTSLFPSVTSRTETERDTAGGVAVMRTPSDLSAEAVVHLYVFVSVYMSACVRAYVQECMHMLKKVCSDIMRLQYIGPRKMLYN